MMCVSWQLVSISSQADLSSHSCVALFEHARCLIGSALTLGYLLDSDALEDCSIGSLLREAEVLLMVLYYQGQCE